MAAHNPQSRSNFPTPVAYPPQVPQQKPVRVDPSAPLPKSFAPIQNPDHAAWPEEVQRNSVSTPEPPKDESVRATSKKRRVSGTGRGPRNSQGASYPQPPAPEVPHALSVPFQGPYVPNGTAPQSSDPTSFAARAHGFSDSEDYPPIDVHAEPEPSPALEKLRRRRSRRRSHHSTDTQELGSHSRPEVAQPSSARSGVPVQQPRLVDIPAQRRVVEHGSVPLEEPPGKAEPQNDPGSPQVRSNARRSSAGQADSRGEWAADRSPLQKLEVKLNDISKEEKRARVEKAEQRLRESKAKEERLRAGLDAEPASDWISTQRASAKPGSEGEISVGKPCQNEYRSIERNRSQRSAAPAYVEDINRQQLERNQASPRDQPVHHPELQSSHTDYPSFEQQQPPQQLSSKSVDNRHVGRGVRFNGEDSNDGPAVNSSPDVAQRSSHNQDLFGASRRAGPQEHHRQEQLPMHGRTSKEVPQQQQALYSGKTRRSERGDDTAASGGAPDPVPKTSVHQYGGPVKYEIPPQTAAGIAARQKVGFDDSLDGSLQAPAHRKHHLSNILHHGHKNAPNSSPQLGNQPRRLDEWRQGGTARLTAADLVVATDDANDKNAWWEKGKTSTRRTSDGAQFQGKAGIDSGESVEDYGQDTRSFNPPLYLKCGPLLRYTGLKRDKLHASRLRSDPSATERESWHGSVMIVTTDEGSDYSTPPTLMLFPEPIELLPPPPQQVNGESRQSLPSEYIDPVAGLPKLSRTGTTVYVKPVEDLEPEVDLSRIETDDGLFEETRTAAVPTSYGKPDLRVSKTQQSDSKRQRLLGKTKSKSQSVKGVRLHAERGVTFWRFNLEVELGTQQTRIAYCINNGSSIGFWVPAKGQSMNIMFHSCNGFSMSVNPANFSGPDPLWRDVLNSHQTRPFHVMIGGGDQIYNDAVMTQTTLFKDWLDIKAPHHKHDAPFSPQMQDELESFYLDRYSMWFSQGLFGMANSQIPMVNLWDDHDIIDGFGSYPHHFMSTPVFCGLGAVAFKYYMLFQQQSVPTETSADEPSWLLGAAPGPYINELSRSIFLSLGKHVAFLGLDCRTERTRDMIMSQASYELAFDRCRREIIEGETRHLIVLLGVPIAYPRLVWLENLLTSRLMDPIKALGRTGMLGGFLNKFDGGVEILDDLDDHWTAKNHKVERKYFIEELQELAAARSVRLTILGGDVHLAAVGQFYSNPKLGIPKDKDHRYMANVISSAIVNTPPPEMMGDILNKRNKTHHFDHETEENMIPMFTHDVDGKALNNKHLLPRRNWCSIREYHPGSTPPQTPTDTGSLMSNSEPAKPGRLQRTLSLTRGDMKPGNLIRRLSQRGPDLEYPPSNEYRSEPTAAPSPPQRSPEAGGYFPAQTTTSASAPLNSNTAFSSAPLPRPGNFHRRPTNMSIKAIKKGDANNDENEVHINLQHGLDIVLNCEVSQKDPAGITVPYRKKNLFRRFGSLRGSKRRSLANNQGQGNWGQSQESYSMSRTPSDMSEQKPSQDASVGRGGAMGLLRRLSQGAAGRREVSRATPPRMQNDEMSGSPSEVSEEQVRQDAGIGKSGSRGLLRRQSQGASGRRDSNRDTPPRAQRDEEAESRLEGMGLFRRPSTREGPKAQQPSTAGEHDRVEGMSLFNREPPNPARVGPISQPIVEGPRASTTTTTTTSTTQGVQPQRRASSATRVEGMGGLFARRTASTNTRPSSQQPQPQPASEPLSLRTMEARATQQQQRGDIERGDNGYPGRRPSKLDRVLGIGHARDKPVEQGKGPTFAARHRVAGAEDGADDDDDDYYSDEGESTSELSGHDGRVAHGYGGIEAYKQQKGWRRFFKSVGVQ